MAAVLAGKKVHKISPAFPVAWTKAEIDQMAEFVYDAGQKHRHALDNNAPEIPAVNYRNEFISGGILTWVNSVRTGKRLKYNPYIMRGGRFRPGGKTNRQLWREASKILLAEYRYWSEKLETNREMIRTGRGYLVEYPKIGNLPFRSNDTFIGGEWSHFSGFWESFIEQLK